MKRKKFKHKNKWEHAFEGFGNTYNTGSLNSFNPELLLKDTEYIIKSKLIKILTQLKGFKFVTGLVIVFKKIKSEDETRFENVCLSSKEESIIN